MLGTVSYKDRVGALQQASTTETVELRRRYRATFGKLDAVKYLSHLDLTRALPRAFRRAGITLAYSQGFHPMPLIQYGPALGVGVVGENELLDFDSPDLLNQDDFLKRMNRVLPDGLRFRSLQRLESGAESLAKAINRGAYAIPLSADVIVEAVERLRAGRSDFGARQDDFHRRLVDQFLNTESCVIERVHKDKRQRVDVRSYTRDVFVDGDAGVLRIVTVISPRGGVKPVEVAAAIYGLTEQEKSALSSRVRRIRLYSEPAVASLPAPELKESWFGGETDFRPSQRA
jgi:radical SAM-linked protein